MTPAEHCLADLHEIRNSMVSISNELGQSAVRTKFGDRYALLANYLRLKPEIYKYISNMDTFTERIPHSSLCMIQFHASSKSLLGKLAQLGYDQLVELYSVPSALG
jgi:hypothetical protein